MIKSARTLITLAIIIAGAISASSILLLLSPNMSLLAFIGWLIFFIAIQSPILVGSQSSRASCTAWLTRFQRRE